ncbi:ankyrin repeat domain-containing protein [Endozoicomonas sp. SM1973]|uniref:Ankyrin repeat domain-containing protein n=1 Tax=Spartinivicinus marinus TaxID=2994442 RepID=A0A853IH69_9GAMM|nr:ankyrin repeat domain-containing protein [Spartinivicinus marinus]MCX4030265.1 ankyrin repeat domain-containing protein [Spartinivicinus marinus]NYZ69858.1 ankyrin repeat domain-containing protein [Spartinivicinus marinus]
MKIKKLAIILSLVFLVSGCSKVSLEKAVVDGQFDELVNLLKKGGDPNTLDADGIPLLSLAFYEGSIGGAQAAKILLNYGADVNKVTNIGKLTPLMYAISVYDVEGVSVLIKHGADPFIKDSDGKDSFNYLKRLRHDETKNKIKEIINEG